MSPTISILSTLLLSLISGSMGSEERMDSMPLLQQSLQYWWKIYKSYNDEVTLGSCWASYLYKISEELSAEDLSAPSSSATTWSLQMNSETPRNQPNLLPRNVTTVTPLKEEQSHEKSTVSELIISDPDKHRVASQSKMIQRRKRWTVNETEPISRTAPNNYSERNSRVDEKKARIASIIDYYAKRRRRAIVPEVLRESPRDGHEFSSRGTSSHAVNPTPNPRDDDKVDFESADPGEEDSRRKVLRSLTSHRDSSVGDASHSFSLKVIHGGSPGGQRFPFRRRSLSRKRNSRVDEVSSDPGTLQENHGIEDDPAGPRGPLNNDGSFSTSSSSQFRRVNAEGSRMSVVKLMDSKGNSSRDPTINSQTPRWMPEELSHDDSLLSPHGESVIAERSFLESRGSGEETVKRDASLQFKMVSDSKKRHSQRSRGRGSSRDRRDVSTATIHPFFSSEFSSSRQQVLDENHELPFVPKIPQESRKDDLIPTARSAMPLLSDHGLSFLTNNEISNDVTKHDEIFNNVGDYKNLTNQSTQHSKHQITCLSASQDPNLVYFSRQPSTESFLSVLMRTLKMFVQVGRRFIDNVHANPAGVCLKDYLWSKFVKWMEN